MKMCDYSQLLYRKSRLALALAGGRLRFWRLPGRPAHREVPGEGGQRGGLAGVLANAAGLAT